jgi:hypothetical protein
MPVLSDSLYQSLLPSLSRLGVTEKPTLLGYVVHSDFNEEFLSVYKNTNHSVIKGFGVLPDMALLFNTVVPARNACSQCDSSFDVYYLFSTFDELLTLLVD